MQMLQEQMQSGRASATISSVLRVVKHMSSRYWRLAGFLNHRFAAAAATLLVCAGCAQLPAEREEAGAVSQETKRDQATQPGRPAKEDESVYSRAAGQPDETVSYGTEGEQIADLRFGGAGAEGRPLVIVVHGGFWRPRWDRYHAGSQSAGIASAGWTVATLEYRRVPGQPDLTLQDVSRSLELLPSLAKRHNGKVLLIGHSAGGHLVLWAGATLVGANIAGVIALAPAADLQLSQQLELGSGAVLAFLGVDAKERPDVDPKVLPTPRMPVTIIHGALDDTVPPEVSHSYVAAHRSARLVELRDTGHAAVIDPLSRAWPTVIEELWRLTGQSESSTRARLQRAPDATP